MLIIAAAYYFLVGLFGGGPDPLINDLKKPIKEHVADSARVAKLLEINEATRQLAKEFDKDFSIHRKKLAELQRRRLTTEAEFTAACTAIDEERAAFRAQVIAGRFAMKELMTAEEWARIDAVSK